MFAIPCNPGPSHSKISTILNEKEQISDAMKISAPTNATIKKKSVLIMKWKNCWYKQEHKVHIL
jgi:hypothetical protein